MSREIFRYYELLTYACKYSKVSLKTDLSNCTEVLVTGFGYFRTQGHFCVWETLPKIDDFSLVYRRC